MSKDLNDRLLINVHIYDGKWKHDIKTTASPDEKRILFRLLYADMESLDVDPDSLKGLVTIIDDIGLRANYDTENSVWAEDILVEILKKTIGSSLENRRDILINISEQLADMYRLGSCPQGRSTRLYQLYLVF
jgi:hypothetical protein